jgi:hypothetical protein
MESVYRNGQIIVDGCLTSHLPWNRFLRRWPEQLSAEPTVAHSRTRVHDPSSMGPIGSVDGAIPCWTYWYPFQNTGVRAMGPIGSMAEAKG